MECFSSYREWFKPVVRFLWTCSATLIFAWHSPCISVEYFDRPTLLVPKRERTDADRERLTTDALVIEARIREQQGDKTQALRRYQRAWRLAGGSTAILKQIVPIALELGRVEEATRYALLLADADLDDPFLAERLAMLMTDQLQYDRSLQLYQRVLQLRSEDPEARNPIAMQFEMGRLYYLADKPKQAAQAFRVVLESLESESSDVLSEAFRKAMLKDAKAIYTLIAESFLEAGDYEAAGRLFRKANATNPQQQWLTFQLARVAYRAGRFQDAQEKLQSYVRQKLRFGGQMPYEILYKMMDEADRGQKQPAAETSKTPSKPAAGKSAFVRIRDWLADDPENLPLISYVAELTRRNGVLQEAATLYEKSLEKRSSPESRRQLLTIYQELGDVDKLLDLLAGVIETNRSFDGFTDQVQAVVADQDLYNRVLRLGRERTKDRSKSNGSITVACGLLALEARDFETAESFLNPMRSDGKRADLFVTWGLQLLVDEKYAQAAKVFEAGIAASESESAEAMLRYYLSGALQLDGQTQAALKVAKQVAQQGKQIPEFALRPAWILYNAGRLQEAEKAYRMWLDEHAEDYSIPGLREVVRDARQVISSICLELNQPDEAIEWLEKILDEYPQYIVALNDLGYLLIDENRSLQRATRMIRYAVEAEPDNASYRDSLGWALFRSGDFQGAIEELKKASSDEQPDPIILDHLADAQWAAGDADAAVKTWNRALSLLSESESKLRQKIVEKLQAAEGQ